MFYQDFSSAILTLLFWWIILLFVQRFLNRYPQKNSWKRDITLSFIQSFIVLILLPVLSYLLKNFG
ncbi:hypothetical protein FZW96_21095 [Bacillus sp. BGMRC 2118]|nr:hypothetical protein FZW96_21095 [Bacillus sp. BGMRC 2118]